VFKKTAVAPRFLVTTALQSTWPEDQPVLFLGEWCKVYSEKNKWEKFDSDTLPYLWNDRRRFEADYHYIDSLYEQVLQTLALKLNHLHQVDYDLRYWRIVSGPWLNIFISTIYERWTHLKKACEEYFISGTYVLDKPCDTYVPLDTVMLLDLIVTDEWNFMIYSFMVKHFTRIPYNKLTIPSPVQKIKTQKKISKIQVFKKTLIGLLNRHKDIVITGAGLTRDVYVKLILKHGIVATQLPDSLTKKSRPDQLLREKIFVEYKNGSDFENCLWRLIAMQLPVSFVENFQFHLANGFRLPLPKNPKVILTTNVYYHEDFRIWLAEKLAVVDQKVKLIIMQHGGSYGVMKWFVNEDYEIKIADEFLTWGWSTTKQKKVTSFSMLKGSPFRPRINFDQPNALMISRSLPRQSYKLASEPISSQILDFNRNELDFISALPENIRSVLMVRLYPLDYGWNERLRLMDRFPDVIITEEGEALSKLGSISRVVIVTYNSTSLLETLSTNIPTIIFWNTLHNELRDDAIPYFEALKSVGIFHENPLSAAKHLAVVWNDISKWWQDKKLQEIVRKFVVCFCNKSVNPTQLVASKLLENSF
jgi:putative transferase (TIGR04331 family)